MSRRPATAGFTLIELLVSLTLLAIVLTSLHTTFILHLHTLRTQDIKVDTLGYARAILDLMVRELRQAGYDPQQAGTCGRIEVAQDACIAVEADTNGDGDCLDADERILYHQDSTHIRRKTDGTIACSGGDALMDVSSGGLVSVDFDYFAQDGTNLGATPADRSLIQRIAITVTIGQPHPDPQYAGTLVTTPLLSNIDLRN